MNPFPSAIRRALLRGLLGLLGAALLAPAAQAQDGKTLRIGFQKYGTLTIVKALGTLDKRLAEQGVTVKWTEFPAGPQLLEGLNVGSIDFGTVGEARRSSPRRQARRWCTWAASPRRPPARPSWCPRIRCAAWPT